MKLTQKFCKNVISACQQANIHECVQHIAALSELTPDDHQQLEILNQEMTEILVKADQKCLKPGNAPWLPQLHEAYAIHQYWNLKHSQFLTGCNYPQVFAKLKHNIPALKLQPPHLHTISANL